MKSLLKELEKNIEELFDALDGFFSPGFDKYNAYSSFTENFSVDTLDTEERSVLENSDNTSLDKFDTSTYRSPMIFYPGIEIRRSSSSELGYGILGRCFPYSGIIEIRNDLYGDDFFEVLTHELTHMHNPHLNELEVRAATRLKMPFTPKWH